MRSKPPGPLGDSSGWCWWSGGKKGRTSGRSMAANRTRFPYFLFPQVDKLAGKVICDLYVRMYFFLFQFTSSFNVSSRKVLRKTIAGGGFRLLFLYIVNFYFISIFIKDVVNCLYMLYEPNFSFGRTKLFILLLPFSLLR